ncbi:MAG: hypothetical protein R6V53_03015 [Candidatus Woesearchaeota archaeon]
MKRAIVIGLLNATLFVFLVGLFVSWGSGYDVSYENDPFWKTMGAIMVLNALGYGAYSLLGKRKKQETKIMEKPDFNKMLDHASQLFRRGEKKEAYAQVSFTVRHCTAYSFGYGELTSSEALDILKDKRSFRSVKECLDICMLVEFAGKIPEEKEFSHALKLAQEAIPEIKPKTL